MTTRKTEVEPRVVPVVGRPGMLDRIPQGWYSASQAAELVGRSRDTLKRWEQNGTYVPSGFMHIGRTRMRLYSESDIVEMKSIAARLHVGRPRNPEEQE